MEDREKEYAKRLGMIYICNFHIEDIEKYNKALKESRAIGIFHTPAFDRANRLTCEEVAMYFKTHIDYHKFLYVLNCINNKEPYNYHDLSNIDLQELLDEINLRMNKIE